MLSKWLLPNSWNGLCGKGLYDHCRIRTRDGFRIKINMEDEDGPKDVEKILDYVAASALSKKPSRIKLSLHDLAQIPWIQAELEEIRREEESYLNGKEPELETDTNVVTVRKLEESCFFVTQELEDGTWTQKLIRKALRTKPIDATHITIIVK